MASVIEQCQVAPPSSSADKMTLPLTFFDMAWIHKNIYVKRILFYKLSIDKNSFVQTIIPNLKHSLSLTLKHYLPLAGNFVCPWNSSGYPELRYVTGDSVSVTFSESDIDFDNLVDNDHLRNIKDLYPFVPQIEEPKDISGVQYAPILAIQVTLFPNYGISICIINHHIAGDVATMVPFIRAWASLNKSGGNVEFMIPFYDRSIVKDPNGLRDKMWEELKLEYKRSVDIISNINVTPLDNNIVKGTFIMRGDDIQKLKNLMRSSRPSLTHVTSYTVTCGYIWTCLAKSEDVTKIIDENEMECFKCTVDCRARFDLPIPSSYFGNCNMWYFPRIRRGDLVGSEGFILAAESIGETIEQRNKDKEYTLRGEWYDEVASVFENHRYFSIVGSPKFDLYPTDFGWGGPEKWEYVSPYFRNLSMTLIKSKGSNGDLEMGLILPKTRMNAFAAIFTHGLSFL